MGSSTPKAASRPSPAAARLRRFQKEFLDGFLRLSPEYNGWFGFPGLKDLDGRWTDFSAEGIERRRAFFEGARVELESLAAAARLSTEERLDAAFLLAQARAQLRELEEGGDVCRDWGLLLTGGVGPFAVLYHQLLTRAEEGASDPIRPLLERVRGTPRLLDQVRENLRRGARQGKAPDRAAVEKDGLGLCAAMRAFLEADLPRETARRVSSEAWAATETVFREACRAAGEAFAVHENFLQTEILPLCGGAPPLDEGEYAWRLRNNLFLDDSPEAVAAKGRDLLRAARERLAKAAEALAPGRDVGSILDSLTRNPADDAELLRAYEDANDRALAFARRERLFRFPSSLAMRWTAVPPSVADHGVVAAYFLPPLHRPGAAGHFFVRLSGGRPDVLRTQNLNAVPFVVVHEASPGHNFQFAHYRDRRGKTPATRLLDPGKSHLGCLGIEGYAHYAEGLMRERGFFRPEEEIFALWGEVWRAARVVVDPSVNTGRMGPEQAVRFLVEEAFFSQALAEEEVERYRRFPTQALGYALGRTQIEELKEAARRALGGAFEEPFFHDVLFDYGFLPPGLLGPALRERWNERNDPSGSRSGRIEAAT